MARRKADSPDPADLRALVADGFLAVRVSPGARSESIVIAEEGVLVKVRAKPQDGAANAAVCRLVAQALGIAASRVQLSRGATSRQKRLVIDEG